MNDLMDSPYKAVQISVLLENRAGRLAQVIHFLGKAGINIRGLSLADTSDFGILRMMVCSPDNAGEILASKGFTTGKTTVVAVEMPDIPGSLNDILQLLSTESINVEYMYAFARRDPSLAVMIFRFENVDEAIELLDRNHVTMIPARELCDF